VRDHHHHPPDRVGRMPDRAIRRTTVRPMPAPPTCCRDGQPAPRLPECGGTAIAFRPTRAAPGPEPTRSAPAKNRIQTALQRILTPPRRGSIRQGQLPTQRRRRPGLASVQAGILASHSLNSSKNFSSSSNVVRGLSPSSSFANISTSLSRSTSSMGGAPSRRASRRAS